MSAQRESITSVVDSLEDLASRVEAVLEDAVDLESLLSGSRGDAYSQPKGETALPKGGGMSLLERLLRIRDKVDRNTALIGEALRLMREDLRPGPPPATTYVDHECGRAMRPGRI